MKLQPDQFDTQSINGYGPGWVAVDGKRFEHSVVVDARGPLQDWDCSRFEDLTPEHFSRLAALGAEIVLFGSGGRIRFPQPQWLRPLAEAGVGLETMDTQAACRTYNILAGEGRHVVVALLLEG